MGVASRVVSDSPFGINGGMGTTGTDLLLVREAGPFEADMLTKKSLKV
jgi:hypothetical protein